MLGMDKPETTFRWLKSMGLAALSGSLGSIVSIPFFMTKTRFQAPGAMNSNHKLGHALVEIGREEGWRGYFRGLSAFMPRVMVASGVQLSTCDHSLTTAAAQSFIRLLTDFLFVLPTR